MQVEWYGQSAFALRDSGTTVFIDPFGDMSAAAARGMRFDYPPISGVEADLLLVTHEHVDHNGVDAIGGSPETLRSTAGRLHSKLGEVLAVASEHDEVAGTQRGPNTLFAFTFGGVRVAHLGDLGQRALRDEQREALGTVDLLFVPVGDGPTIGAEQATAVAAQLGARWIVPMHYRTERISFLDPNDAFLAAAPRVARLQTPAFELDELGDGPLVVVPTAP
ncbi:MAG TPA: MBL fold metallo-hydrolase [Solirubrobacteraceae bacterium]|jgi:L-ascorbate metabolism protein UlaG (beta-lactamase superfamily)